MLAILARLCIIGYKDFGYSCFGTLKDLLRSSSELRPKVCDVLLCEVINKFRQEDPTEIPRKLLEGLHELIGGIGSPAMLTGMYDHCFPMWLRAYSEHRLVDRGSPIGDDDHFDAVIKLVAVSVRNHLDNVEFLLDKRLAQYIVKIATYSDMKHRRYIPTLNIIADMSNQSPRAADFFMAGLEASDPSSGGSADRGKGELHEILTRRIMRRLEKLKDKEQVKDWLKGLGDEANAKWLEFCKTLQAEIVTLGGLLASNHNRWKILRVPSKKNR